MKELVYLKNDEAVCDSLQVAERRNIISRLRTAWTKHLWCFL